MFSTGTSAVAENGKVTRKIPPHPQPIVASDWLDEWNSPVVATAAAVSALVISEQHGSVLSDANLPDRFDAAYQGDLCELIVSSVHWLARQQRADGGFGGVEFDRVDSSLPTTVFVRSAFQLTGAPAAYPELMSGMNDFIQSQGGLAQMHASFGPNHSGGMLIQGAVGLTETLDCTQMPNIPIETASFGRDLSKVEFWSNRGTMLPAIVAMGLASYEACKPLNPITSWRRSRACRPALDWLSGQQKDDGGFCGSVPATSMIVLSLASIAQASSPMVRRGVEYLFANLSEDGHWLANPQDHD